MPEPDIDEILDPIARLGDALSAFALACDADPASGLAWAGRSAALLELGRPADALAAAGTAVTVDEDEAVSWIALGNVRLAMDEPAEALRSADRAMELEEPPARAQGLRHRALDRLGRDREAAAALDDAMRLTLQRLHLGLGSDWEGQFEEALAEVDMDLLLSPGDAGLQVRRGRILLSLALHERELLSARRGVREDPEEPFGWYMLADALYGLGRYADSAEAARRCVDLDPTDDTAWSSLGIALELLDRDDEALAAFERARDLEPGYSGHWESCGQILEQMGRDEEAQRMYERAMDLAATEDDADAREWDATAGE